MRASIFQEEKNLWRKGFKRIVGLDESGRGPLAGPVLAAAVLVKAECKFKFGNDFTGINDSKKLSKKKRERFYKLIIRNPFIEWGIGRVSEKAIDKINILEASKLAMIKAVENLKSKAKNLKIDYLVIDGNFKIDYPLLQKPIIKADEKVFSCMAAGIIAKVVRDRLMDKCHKKYPLYGFDKNKGYPTKQHFQAIKKHGSIKIHRKSFRLLKNYRVFDTIETYDCTKTKTHKIEEK